MTRRDDLRRRAMVTLQEHEVLMLDGHFDFGNGYHGRVYLNPHGIFRQPSLIWRLTQDVIDILPEPIVSGTEVVAGPVMGGALFAHTLAGLLDGRRSLGHPACSFAPLSVSITLPGFRSRSTTRTDRSHCAASISASSPASACCWPTMCAIRARRSSVPAR